MGKIKNFHESYTEHKIVEGPSNRNFGYTVGGIFAAIGLVKCVFFSITWLASVFLLVGAGLVGAAFIKPDALTPLNKLWMKLGLLLFHVVNPVIMFLLFVVVFIPAGLIMKFIGYDPMAREIEPESNTYWIKKKPAEIENPMKYQF